MSLFLSIIIPCKDLSGYIQRCLQSIMLQNGEGVEVICVDDGSKDDTVSILEQTPGVIVLRSVGGVSAARNTGLDRAKGEWVWFVDGDDEVAPGAIEGIRRCNKEADCIYFSAEVINHHIRRRLADITLSDEVITKPLPQMLRDYNKPYVWNGIFSRRFLAEKGIRFPKGLTVGEDMSFQMQVFLNADKVAFSSDIIYRYHYLERESAMKGAEGKRDALNHIAIVDNVFDAIKYPSLPLSKRKLLGEWAFDFAVKGAADGETIAMVGAIVRKYRVAAESVKNRLKSRVLRSKLLCGLYIKAKGVSDESFSRAYSERRSALR